MPLGSAPSPEWASPSGSPQAGPRVGVMIVGVVLRKMTARRSTSRMLFQSGSRERRAQTLASSTADVSSRFSHGRRTSAPGRGDPDNANRRGTDAAKCLFDSLGLFLPNGAVAGPYRGRTERNGLAGWRDRMLGVNFNRSTSQLVSALGPVPAQGRGDSP